MTEHASTEKPGGDRSIAREHDREWYQRRQDEEPQYLLTLDEPYVRMGIRSPESWAEEYRAVTPERAEDMRQALDRGQVVRLVDGRQLEGADLIVLRQRLRRATAGLPTTPPYRQGSQRPVIRDLIPGWWPWGTVPQCIGTPKVGKTELVGAVTAALVVPGHRFLGRFEPATLTKDERTLGTIVINAETPRVAFEEVLRRHGAYPNDLLDVIHLEDEGGPGAMDLTDPDKFDYWVWRLNQCETCDGSADWSPIAVIVDGLTAILTEVGKTTSDYNAWESQFRRLLRVLGTPNGLYTAHSYLTVDRPLGGVENMAGADGLWRFMADEPTDPGSVRRLSVQPRTGGHVVPPFVVARSEDGRLLAAGAQTTASEQPSVRDEVLAYVEQCNGEGFGPTVTETRAASSGGHTGTDAVLAALVEEGLLVVRPRPKRGGGREHWLPDHPGLPVDPEKSA